MELGPRRAPGLRLVYLVIVGLCRSRQPLFSRRNRHVKSLSQPLSIATAVCASEWKHELRIAARAELMERAEAE